MGGHRGCVASALTLAFMIFVHGASCEDLVTGSVSESSSSQSGDQSMPDSLTLNVTVGGQGVHLQLQVDQNVDCDFPVFILSSNEDGKLETKRVKLNNTEDFAVYHDVTQGAAFSARRRVDENGQSYLSLEGILQVEGKMYDLKSTGRRNQNSSEDTMDRKSSLPEDSVTHAPGHDVKRRDVSGDEAKSGQNEAEENHEFVVHLRDDLLAGGQRGDAVAAPPTVVRTIEMRTLTGNKLPPPPVAAPPPVRRRRQSQQQNIYIDVVAVVDYAVFSDWYTRSSAVKVEAKTQDAILSISQYYAFVYSGVNMLYEGISSSSYSIHVKLSALVVATSGAGSTWTESLRQKSSPRDVVNTNAALTNFSNWASTTNTLPSYDHLTLFSGYELTKTDGTTTSDAITGLAYLNTLCSTTGKSTSVVEDHGGFRCIFTAAHELGHSLSAEHDGNENTCSASDQFIMASTSSVASETNKLNLWRFSSCSISSFNTFISNQLKTARGQQCLNNALTSNNIPDVSSLQPGQVYDYDAQCRQTYGPSSSMCRGVEFYSSAADICTTMFCNEVTTANRCAAVIAARGTSCGNKKWCVNGQCVFDTQAPSLSDDCPFGDQPGVVFINQTCAQLVSGYPAYCYQDSVLKRCCGSCAKYYIGLQNCEYGDKATGCLKNGCSIAGSTNTNYLSSCCGTCSYGTRITTRSTNSVSADVTSPSSFSTPTTTSTVITTIVSTTTLPTIPIASSTSTLLATTATTIASTSWTSASKTTTATRTAAGSATATTTRTPEACLDNETDSSVCSTLRQTPSRCYNGTVRQHCCATCSSLSESSMTGDQNNPDLYTNFNGAPPVYSSSLRTIHLMCALYLLWNSRFLMQNIFYSI